MADVHAFEDALKTFEDVVALVAAVRAGGITSLPAKLAAGIQLLGDVQTLVADVPDFKAEVEAMTVDQVKALAVRAVSDVYALCKAVA